MLYFIVSLVTYFTYLVLKARRNISYFKQQKYDSKKIKLLAKDKFLTIELLGIIIVVLVFFLSSKIIGIIFIVFYMLLSLIEIRKSKPLKLDKTGVNILTLTLSIYLILFFIISVDFYNYQKGFIFYNRVNYYYIVVFIAAYLEYILMYFVLKLNNKKQMINTKKVKNKK